jgi:hypothetical protein
MNYSVAICLLSAALVGCAHRDREEPERYYPYHKPLSSPGSKFGGLPPRVQNSVRAQSGAAEIYDISKLTMPDRVVYEVIFRDSQLFPPLYVASDGSVMYPDLMTFSVMADRGDIGPVSGGATSGMKLGDLPAKVVNTIQEMAPSAEVSYINRIVSGDTVMYDVSFKEPRQPRLLISDSGKLIDKRPAY